MIIKYVRLEKKKREIVFFRGVSRFEIEMFLAGGEGRGGGISFQVLPPETFEQSSHLSTHPFSNRFTNLFILYASLRSLVAVSRCLVEKKKKKKKENTRNALQHRERRVDESTMVDGMDGASTAGK